MCQVLLQMLYNNFGGISNYFFLIHMGRLGHRQGPSQEFEHNGYKILFVNG